MECHQPTNYTDEHIRNDAIEQEHAMGTCDHGDDDQITTQEPLSRLSMGKNHTVAGEVFRSRRMEAAKLNAALKRDRVGWRELRESNAFLFFCILIRFLEPSAGFF